MIDAKRTKLSVTLYCFTKEYHSGHYSLEDCIAKAVEAGAEGIEIVNTQHIEGFPKPKDEFIEKFKSLMQKYGTKPVCYGTYTDTGIRTDGELTLKEMADQLRVDIDLAQKMGFPLIRVGPNTPFEVLEEVYEEAKQKKVKIGIEVHAPWSVSHPEFKEMLRKVKALDSNQFGFVPDFSCFAVSVPKILAKQAVDLGVPRIAVNFVAKGYNQGISLEELKEKAHKRGFPKEMDELIDLFYHVVVRGIPEELAEVMPYANHVHAKFWELNRRGEEANVPYEPLLKIIKESGFEGYISSEYEGYVTDKKFNGFEATKKHQKMLRKYLNI